LHEKRLAYIKSIALITRAVLLCLLQSWSASETSDEQKALLFGTQDKVLFSGTLVANHGAPLSTSAALFAKRY
jgi:hypothetical protein